MNFEWLIAKRYIWSKRRHPFVGVISTISVLGIAVGVAALIVVLAVMNGFDEELKDRIIGMRSYLTIQKDIPFTNYETVIRHLEKAGDIRGVSPFVEGQALVQKDEWGAGVLVRGVDTIREKKISQFYRYITRGTLSEKGASVVVGVELAKKFRLNLGSEISVLTQNAKKPKVYVVEGIFSSGMYEYDANILFLNLKNAQELFEIPGAVSGLSVALEDAGQANKAKRNIQESLGPDYFVQTWMEMNKTLFGALKLEKIVMFLILALIILVACLNIAGSLTIMVMDKTKDIGVLKSLGARPLSLMRIFAIDGLVIGFLGAATGFAVGMALCFLLKNYSFVELPREIYYMDKLPVQMSLGDNLRIFAMAILLSFLSACYPAITAGRLDPVKALRYE